MGNSYQFPVGLNEKNKKSDRKKKHPAKVKVCPSQIMTLKSSKSTKNLFKKYFFVPRDAQCSKTYVKTILGYLFTFFRTSKILFSFEFLTQKLHNSLQMSWEKNVL